MPNSRKSRELTWTPTGSVASRRAARRGIGTNYAALAEGSSKRLETPQQVHTIEAGVRNHGRDEVVDRASYTWFNLCATITLVVLWDRYEANFTDTGTTRRAKIRGTLIAIGLYSMLVLTVIESISVIRGRDPLESELIIELNE